MNGQVELTDMIEGTETYEIKPLIYSLSLSCFKTVCPYCKMENPDATELKNAFMRIGRIRNNKKWYPYADKPLDYCPSCGKRFDTKCEVRMTKDFMKLNTEYVSKLQKDQQGRYREV